MSRPTADEIREWMKAQRPRASFKQAGEHFGLTKRETKLLVQGGAPHARPPTPARAREADDDDEDRIPDPPVRPEIEPAGRECEECGHVPSDAGVMARWRAGLSEIDWALDKVVQVEEALERLASAPRISGQAIAALFTRAREAKAEVVRILANAGPLDGASPEQVAEYLRRIFADAEDEHLELAMTEYGERHGGRVWFVGDNGHRAELDPETGWQTQTG